MCFLQDMVDILVGWHIDATQPEHVVNMTSQSLIRLHDYWIEDLSFSLTLLGQFLEDIEAYSEVHVLRYNYYEI